MKHHRLRSVAHNLADSLASGLCFVIGYHLTDVFAEAASSPGGVIEVDFLQGRATKGIPSKSLQRALEQFRLVLPEFCMKNGVVVDDFCVLSARYGRSIGYEVHVEDREGRSSAVRYVGNPGKRPLHVDSLGRVRRAKVRVHQTAAANA